MSNYLATKSIRRSLATMTTALGALDIPRCRNAARYALRMLGKAAQWSEPVRPAHVDMPTPPPAKAVDPDPAPVASSASPIPKTSRRPCITISTRTSKIRSSDSTRHHRHSTNR